MGDVERIEGEVSAENEAGEDNEQQVMNAEQRGKLPLDALLYSVLYGDEPPGGLPEG